MDETETTPVEQTDATEPVEVTTPDTSAPVETTEPEETAPDTTTEPDATEPVEIATDPVETFGDISDSGADGNVTETKDTYVQQGLGGLGTDSYKTQGI